MCQRADVQANCPNLPPTLWHKIEKDLLSFQIVSFWLQVLCCQSVTACWFCSGTVHADTSHTHTKRIEESRPHVLPTLCQCRESVDADCGIKGEFHPQDPFFPLHDTINLRCSVHSSTYFVIKCCNLLIRCPSSLSTSPPAPLPNASLHFPEWRPEVPLTSEMNLLLSAGPLERREKVSHALRFESCLDPRAVSGEDVRTSPPP